jgi:uncharacterized protein YceH (UPF0502 family)
VNDVLERLIARGFVIRHPRRPGQKEERYEQVLGGDDAVELVPAPPAIPDPADPRSTFPAPSEARSTLPADTEGKDDHAPPDAGNVDRASAPAPSVAEETDRLDRLEADLLDLKGEITKLREALGD